MSNLIVVSPMSSFLLFLILYLPAVLSQSPASAPVNPPSPPALLPPAPSAVVAQTVAPGPAPSGPPNITHILEKSGHFNTLIRLLKSTKIDSEIYKQLNDSSQGLTVFAPTDNAFGKLTAGALNAYSDQQKFLLVKFHMVPSFLSTPEFQTLSNPVSTEAGSINQYPVNITNTASGVNLTSGIVNTTLSGTVYSDNQLAVYQVDKVLLPLGFYQTPSPAPAPSKPTKTASLGSSGSAADASTVEASGANHVSEMVFAGLLAATALCFWI